MKYISPAEFESASRSLVLHHRPGSSGRVAALTGNVAETLKRAASTAHETRSSKVLSQGQKAAAFKKLHGNLDAKGTADVNQLAAAVASEKAETEAAIAKHFNRPMSDEMAFLLVQSLRGQQDAAQIVKTDSRYFAALEKVPSAVAGLTTEQVETWRELAIMSTPELAEMRTRDKANESTLEHAQSLAAACAGWLHSQVDEAGLAEFERLSAGEL